VVLYVSFLLLFEIILSVESTGGTVWAVYIVVCDNTLYRLWTVLVVLCGPFVLLFEIIPSVDSTGGTVCVVFIVLGDNTFCGEYW